MAKYITKRIIYLIITLFIIASVTFFLMKFLPGTPFSNEERLTIEQRELLNAKYGLDQPVPVQYMNYMVNIVKGDLGVSFQFENQPVMDLLMNRMGPSLQLGVQAMIIGTIIGVALGVLAAMFQNTWIDYGSTFLAILGKSIPSFVLAALLQYYIGVKLELLPVASWNSFSSSILPTIALACFPIATAARFMRTELIEVFGSDYITLAKAKGNSRGEVAVKHAIRNALIPLITVLGPMAVGLMTGSMVVEKVFAVPGIGEQFVKSIMTNDFPIIMGTTLFFAFLLTVIILIIDILYGIIDPRIRLNGGDK
ncbi:oligopeptide ABC transporter permease [Oceanobacillus neutriphilus]|uniref:Peptide ABC transporter permease n=1 Tax=Oceanobacillus neutriphilus TaxID=531815 RepID=A0ABQ2NV68_9BACI|nr:oligopeptide ABC transporter permease [Oceanobacillus neutriphilus]GGP11364.1 peptide ABC transporter permease [Oceanobacillus neutriphilus]